MMGADPGANAESLITQLNLLLEQPQAVMGDEHRRQKLRYLARAVSFALEKPYETVFRIAFSPILLSACRVGVDFGVFSAICASDGGITSFEQIQSKSGLEKGFLKTLLDFFTSYDLAKVAGADGYKATRLCREMTTELFRRSFLHMNDVGMPAIGALKASLDPSAAGSTAFSIGHNTQDDFYHWIGKHADYQNNFHCFLEALAAGNPVWLNVVNFPEELGKDLSNKSVAFVDVAGGSGRRAAQLRKSYPEQKGRMILQDRADLIGRLPSIDGVEKMSYDFFTKQPVKGARVYYFHEVMHNNTDDDCVRILKSQVPAMDAKSVIILDEKWLPEHMKPEDNPDMDTIATLSIMMQVCFKAQQRHEDDWRELLGKAGLVLREVRIYSSFSDAAIIAALPQHNGNGNAA